jgi:hypothetical protein
MVPTVALPPEIPSTVQVAGPPPGTVAVNCCDCDSVNAAFRGATLKLFGFVMLTVTEAVLLPPPPVQVSVNVVAALNAPLIALPLGDMFPLQPPEAVHAVAFVELHFSVVAAPLTTEAGLAVSATVGGEAAVAVTVTVEIAGLVPAAPAHVSVKLVVALSGPVLALPFVGLAPLQPPEAVHPVVFAELHISVAALPSCTVVGFALIVAVGAGPVTAIVTAAVAGEVPVAPVQLSVKVVDALSAGVVKAPLVGSAPLQPPEAVHAVAFAELHVSVATPPVWTLIVLAFSATLGEGSVGADDPPEEHPPRITAHAAAAAQIRQPRTIGGRRLATRTIGCRWLANRCVRKIARRVE